MVKRSRGVLTGWATAMPAHCGGCARNLGLPGVRAFPTGMRTSLGGLRSSRVPQSLLALLVVVGVVGVAWAVLQPPFQVTDEDVHFSYVDTLAQRGALPGDPTRKKFASDFVE